MALTTLRELEREYDTVVVGSGAAGLVAALAAAESPGSVCVLEKAAQLGGTTAAGGGVIWAPGNALAGDAGYADTFEDGVAYVRAATGGALTEDEIGWYVRNAADAVAFLHARTRASFTPLARPDYHMEWPGASAGGRSLDNTPFDPVDHPELRDAIRPSSYFPPLSMAERDELNGREPDADLLAARRESGVRTMGGALIGALAASALDRGITIAAAAPVTGLVPEGESGWILSLGDERRELRARRVVIASGGFEWNAELRRAFLPFPVTPISAPSNEGDGLTLGLAVGAAVEDMTAIWGVPVITPPEQSYDGQPSGRMGNVELTLPGSVLVNGSGNRFVNEALNYHDLTRVFASIDPMTLRQRNDPCWLVFDARYRALYPVAGSPPGHEPSWMPQAPTLAELAEQIGVDTAGLVAQVERFNPAAARGEDPEFGRGQSPQDRFLGDATHAPNPCLRPLDQPPFFAVRVHPGVLGTSGGLATDPHGRVRRADGSVIPGLYAAGNVSAGAFRNNYPGGGATLGSAVTRGYVAGRHIAGTA